MARKSGKNATRTGSGTKFAPGGIGRLNPKTAKTVSLNKGPSSKVKSRVGRRGGKRGY